MAKAVIIGIPGEEGLWLADLDAGTVKPLNPTGELATASSLRKAGGIFVKGVDLAVAVSSAQIALSGHVDG
ncbi:MULTISPECIES: hypothetical protein [Rhizobium]|jgi:hypothetical protein|uniref:Uncharacterized protein n=1 Tax=Rhizobium esperanzae TaxID=1967781 RepID=A0A246DY76_9HYPH|nr:MULTISPECIES: hypothetical protein [Rhizobium]ANK86845.1 hypothetical protein AMK02_CH03298 [Rhizobium sp. N731]ANK92799.1 hypothetical protein AMK01_CH03378 [Rhizobium sp. N6212]ANK98846.1 hypothetical protein AMK00_CH03382 [Rhizobium sp. N621]ANL04974.1 hypothetical protein AMJ99_CH03458 [Rhizobium esperanzae]ANL11031.1 hypothetical protein AMJ98_CH03409 [Rhizobium sp. N1341]